jgi:V8-like Glu-specific endopeptidase
MKKIQLEGILMRKVLLFVSAVLLLSSSVFVPAAYAQDSRTQVVVGVANTETQADIEAYWTPERLLSAKPIEVHPAQVDADGFPIVSAIATQEAPSVSVGGAPPSVEIGNTANKILVPGGFHLDGWQESGVTPDATSPLGAYFTTLRVFPDAATTTYPYRTAGQLFFTDPRTGGNFVCTASVLRPRVIVTAGHCTSHGSTSSSNRYFYSKWMFVPSENQGKAPNGTWTWSYVVTTTDWYNNGSVPNQQDVGMLVMADQKFCLLCRIVKIGQVTGYLGYEYCNGTNCSKPPIADNNITMIGYPCNLDSCSRMEQTNAQTYESGGSNTWMFGSVMQGGASGGPWIQDFGVAPSGAPSGLLGNNYVSAVTSYGPTQPSNLMYLGASAFDTRFLAVLNTACKNAGTGGC